MNNTNNNGSRFKKNPLSAAVSTAIIPLVLATSLSAFAAEEDKSSEQTKSAEEEQIEVIQVTGILGSLEASARIKRYAETVVDVITSEDIGQFSDDSIAGAIQRIPGVQIETDDAGTDGDRVSIRGLGPGFVNSTINGRRLLSSGNEGRNLRKMNFNAFPPSVLSGVKVTKGSSARSPESGLAGQVDLETLKPLALRKLKKKNTYTSIGVRGGLNSIDDNTGYRFNVLSAYRNDDNNFGGYISLVAGEEKNARDQLRNNWDTEVPIQQIGLDGEPIKQIGADGNFIDKDGRSTTDIDAAIDEVAGIVTGVTTSPIRETPKRVAFATGLQYQPTEDIDINWDLMYSKYNNESTRNQFQYNLTAANVWVDAEFNNSEPGNPGIVLDENNIVRYANFGKTDNAASLNKIKARTTFQVFDNNTENVVTGLNVDWIINDRLTANFDGYVSLLDYDQELRSVRYEKILDASTFIYDGTGLLPVVIAPDANIAEGYEFSTGGSIRLITTSGENYGATAAFNYEMDDNYVISSIDFGVHADRTDIEVRRTDDGSRIGDGSNTKTFKDDDISGDIPALSEDDRLTKDFLSGDFSPTRYLIPNYDALVALEPRIAENGFAELGVDPDSSYNMVEDIYALYTQVNMDSEAFGIPFTGNFGIRAVYTDNSATALQINETTDDEEIITTVNDYWTYLPSLNLNFSINDNMALRVGISRTMSRPDYQDTAPINRIKLAGDVDENDGDDDEINTITRGNPDLKPESSENLDITFEWYTEYDSVFILSGFYKEIDDYILKSEISGQTLDGFNDELDTPLRFTVKESINFSDGTAEGFEIGLLQPLGKIIPALEGFGFSINYTYVDSEFERETVGDNGFGFPGSSKDNFNFIGFYEADFYTVRLAYTYRGSFLRTLGDEGSQGSTSRFSGEQEKLNLSLNLKPMKGLSVKLGANNITDEKRRDFFGSEEIFVDYFERGRTYSITAKYSF